MAAEDLSTADIVALTRCLRRVYAHCDAEGFPGRAVAALAELVPAESHGYDQLDFRSQQTVTVRIPADADRRVKQLDPVFVQLMGEHPLVKRFHQTHDGRAYKISDLVGRTEWHQQPLYNEFFRMIGTEDQLVACLPTPPHLIIGLVCNRGRRNFEQRERTLINLLRPHMVQAYDNAQAISKLKNQEAATRGLLDLLDAALIALKPAGTIRFCTNRAKLSLERHCPTWRRNPRNLPNGLAQWASQMIQCSMADDPSVPCEPFIVQSEAGLLRARLLPDQSGSGWIIVLDDAGDAPAKGRPPDPRIARLPPRLRGVLDRLLAGDSEKQAAAALGLTYASLHQYVKMLYRALDVSSRGELMAKISRG